MTAFQISLSTDTPIILNRWLTLDASLDGILEQNGVEAGERRIPLLAWDGETLHENLTAADVRAGGMVFCASAAIPGEASVRMGSDKLDETRDPIAAVPHPPISSITFKGGANPGVDFRDGEFPFEARRKVFDTARGETGRVMRKHRTVLPTTITWHAQGDPDAVLEIIRSTPGIGAKTRNGFGRIDQSSVVVKRQENAPKLYGVVAMNGSRLLRPTPARLLDEAAIKTFHQRIETCAPPYWDKAGAVHAFVPKTNIDALLTI